MDRDRWNNMTLIVLPSKAIFYGDKSGTNKFNLSTRSNKWISKK